MRTLYSEHSAVGGSGAKRWMACPGSVRASKGLPEREMEDFTAQGIVAHEVAAEVLRKGKELWTMGGDVWELGEFRIEIGQEMVSHLQLYVDTVLGALPKDHDVDLLVEQRVSYAELGYPQAFGTLDAAFVEQGLPDAAISLGDTLHVFDLKYGEGIFVRADDPQFRYYAGAVVSTFPELTADVTRIKIWVIQPRIDWAGPKVRTHELSREDLAAWVHDRMLPAIDATRAPDALLAPGDHCQFCPVVLCQARLAIGTEIIETFADDPSEIIARADDAKLGHWLEKWQLLRGLGKAMEREAFARMQRGRDIPGQKLVEAKTSRTGKPGYEAAAVAKWGNQAYKPVAVMTIPQLEKLPGGKKFAQEWGHKPQGEPTLAPASDNRPAIKGTRSSERAFAALLTSAASDE